MSTEQALAVADLDGCLVLHQNLDCISPGESKMYSLGTRINVAMLP